MTTDTAILAGHAARRRRMPARDWQILAAAYLPIIAFGAAMIAAQISRTRRHQLQAVLR